MKIFVSIGFILALVIGIIGVSSKAFAQTWTQLTNAPGTITVSCSADGQRVMTASGDGEGYFSTNAGITWSNHSTGLGNAMFTASSADGRTLYMCAGGLQASTNFGFNWNKVTNTPTFNNYSTFHFINCSGDGTRLLATVFGGYSPLYTSPDSGVTWISNNLPVTNWLAGAVSSDGNTIVAISIYGNTASNYDSAYISTNFGQTWNLSKFPPMPTMAVATSANGAKIVIAANNGQIFTSTNSGVTWKTNSNFAYGWSAVASSADGNRLVVVAYTGQIYSSTNSGAIWLPNNASGNGFLTVASSSDGLRQFAGAYSTTRVYSTATNPSRVRLSSTSYNGNVKISWPVISTNVALQQYSASSTAWVTLTNLPTVNPTNLYNELVLPMNDDAAFYRLVTQ